MRKLTKNTKTQQIRDVRIGRGVKIYNFVNLYECEIGDDTKVGSFVEIQKGVKIGKRCKISSHTFICEGVTIGDNVFVGHNVTFINDKHPRAVGKGKILLKKGEWKMIETVVEDDVSIGSSATIMCGVRIGKGAVIGAGSVVTKDVKKGATAVGNPARIKKS